MIKTMKMQTILEKEIDSKNGHFYLTNYVDNYIMASLKYILFASKYFTKLKVTCCCS